MAAQDRGIGSVLALIVGVAIVAVVVNPNTHAAEVIASLGTAFANLIRNVVGGPTRPPRRSGRPPRGRTHPRPPV